MTNWVEWLLDLDSIRLERDAPLTLRWDPPTGVEAWMLVCFALIALGWIGLVYRREQTSVARRIVLSAVRCAVVALAVAVLCRPALVLQRDRVEPSYVALALDTSSSMDTTEEYRDAAVRRAIVTGAALADPVELSAHSRLGLVVSALAAADALPLRTLLLKNDVQLCTFGGSVDFRGLFSTRAGPDDLLNQIKQAAANQTSTDIAAALDGILRRARGRRLSAIVLASDGQSTRPGRLRDVLDLARDRQVRVYPIRIGSTAALRDLELRAVVARETAFVNDIVAVEAQISARGLSGPVSATARLVDERFGTVVDTRDFELKPDPRATTIELHDKPTLAGDVRYRVEVVPLPDEAVTDDNAETVDVTVLNRQLRVLYCEGYPRYEYRFLKNALLREKTITLSVLLLEADERFVQEGTEPIRRFPETPEELNRYDVVIFGDVDPRGGWLTPAQMNMLLDFVGNTGGGFATVAGERACPYRFLGTPLEKLLPVRIDPAFFGRFEGALTVGFRARLTVDGRSSRMFRPPGRRARDTDVSSTLQDRPELYWYARTLGPKPGARVLVDHPDARTELGPMPIVVDGRYGAGKIFFQATDDTWRWRRGTGELAHDTYWVQVIRALTRGSRVSQDRRFVLQTDHRRYAYGAPVQTRVRFFDSNFLAEQDDRIDVAAKQVGQDAGVADEPGRDAATTPPIDAPIPVAQFPTHRVGPQASVFEGSWIPPRPGRYVLEPATLMPRSGNAVPKVRIRVDRPDLETRRPEANHDNLLRIARHTGGKIVDLDELAGVFGEIANHSARIPDDVVEPLWDSKLALVLFALMISMEWIARKMLGLL